MDVPRSSESEPSTVAESEGDDGLGESRVTEQLSPEVLEERRVKCKQLKDLGNARFKENNLEEAVDLYTQAIELCPNDDKEKAILHNNRAAAYFHMDGEEYQEKALQDCDNAIILNPCYAKPYLKRGQVIRKAGMKEKLDQALEDYEKVVELDPDYKEGHAIIRELKQEIEKRNEEMKNEMIGKLKDLGNFVLNKFGLSTDNFQMVQNPENGSYSVNFKR